MSHWARASRVPAKARLRERVQQDVGQGRPVEAQLVGPQGGTAGAVGKQGQLLLLDAVLHIAAGAIQVLIQRLGRDAVCR